MPSIQELALVPALLPAGNTQAVQVHQLSKRSSQNPFRKNRGRVVRVLFHPLKPFLFVATQNHVRIYNLAKQELAKKLMGASGIASMAVHSSGDHVLVGCEVTSIDLRSTLACLSMGCARRAWALCVWLLGHCQHGCETTSGAMGL